MADGDPTGYLNQGNSYSVGKVATEGLEPGQNSLTQMLRSLTNYGGTKGSELVGQGVGMMGQSLGANSPASGYFRNLLSGDRATNLGLLQPQTDALGQQFGQIRQMFANQGRGGGKTSALAQLPTQEVGQISNLLSSGIGAQRGAAASGLVGMGGLGLQAGGELARLGTGLTGTTLQSILGERGQDIGETGRNLSFATGLIDALV